MIRIFASRPFIIGAFALTLALELLGNAHSQPVPVNPPIGSCSGVFCTASSTGSGSVGVLQTNPVLITPNLGTPSSINLTNATNVPVNNATGLLATANGGLGANNSASTGVPLFAAGVVTVTGTSGTGNFARVISPVFTTPNLGTPSSIGLANGTGLPLSTGVTGQLPNANLLNAATTVNGQSCVLGSTCTISAASTSLTPNSTLCQSCTAAYLLYTDGTKVQQEISATPLQGGKPSNRYTYFTTTTTNCATASSTLVMCGYGHSFTGGVWTITPATGGTGNIRVRITGEEQSVSSNPANLQFYYGTGTAPSAGAAVTGTAMSGTLICDAPGTPNTTSCPASMEVELTGKTAGTALWFDAALNAPANNAYFAPYSVIIEEF